MSAIGTKSGSEHQSTPAFAPPTQSDGWIPTSHRMPERIETVIVIGMSNWVTEPQPHLAYWDGEEWLTDPGADIVTDVTHWMPMPAAPGKEAK